VTVSPIGDGDTLRIALYGDSRDGHAPHRRIVEEIAQRDFDVVVHTGDIVRSADDQQDWVEHLAATLPLSSRTPLILALGNHELYNTGRGGLDVEPLAKAMAEIPPPADPIAREVGAPLAAFHVRVGPALFISLDSNQSLAQGTKQLQFLERVLEQKGDARYTFVAFHHGPMSSGPHGPHPDSRDIVRVLEKYKVTAVFAGHDHIYERLVHDGITYFVSGGGGAPLYTQSRVMAGSMAFAPTYNWVQIIARNDQDELGFETFSLEGATLDRGSIVPVPESTTGNTRSETEVEGIAVMVGSIALLLAGFAYVAVRLLISRRSV
jgi:3',5'-cyclic AMP phosphodiesterase CpdA